MIKWQPLTDQQIELIMKINELATIHPPRNLGCVYSEGNLTATWDEPSSGGGSFTGYRLHRYDCAKGGSCGVASEVCLPKTTRTYTWTGLSSKTYTVHVRAIHDCPHGDSSSSTISQCTTTAPPSCGTTSPNMSLS